MNIELQDPVPETFAPVIHACITRPVIHVASHDPANHVIKQKQVEVVRRDDPSQAYLVVSSMGDVNLDHHSPGWGDVRFGISLPRAENHLLTTDDGQPLCVFQAPNPRECTYVAIKRLDKAVVQDALARGKNENPYKEISRMQELGDDHHVLSCVEALEDERYLYIIMPYCEQRSLVEWIPWNQGVQEHQARDAFQQIMENLLYLQSHGLCHRDLSPDNCMIHNGRIVFTDMAMSFRIPESGWVTPLGGFGKPAYLSPEVYNDMPFEGQACDTWSVAVILFNLLTGHILCTMPIPADLKFRYLVLAQGIARNTLNEQTYEILMDEEETDERQELLHIIQKCLNLSPEAQALLQGSLTIVREQRWTAGHILSSPWMSQDPPP